MIHVTFLIFPFRNWQKPSPLSHATFYSFFLKWSYLGASSVSNGPFKISYKMFSFSQSGQDPTLPLAVKCPSLSRSHPSRGCVYRPRETWDESPRYTPSRYPAPRRMNPPPPPRLRPLRAMTSVLALARPWSLNLVGWGSRGWEGQGLIDSCLWLRTRGSSGSGKSEGSERRRKRGKICVNVCTITQPG